MKYLLPILLFVSCKPSKSRLVDQQFKIKKEINENLNKISKMEQFKENYFLSGEQAISLDSIKNRNGLLAKEYDSLEFEIKKY